MRKHGGTPSRRDKHVTLAANSPPGVARGRFVEGQQSGLAGCKPPPLFTHGTSSCSSQGRRQGEPWGASPRPSAPTLPTSSCCPPTLQPRCARGWTAAKGCEWGGRQSRTAPYWPSSTGTPQTGAHGIRWRPTSPGATCTCQPPPRGTPARCGTTSCRPPRPRDSPRRHVAGGPAEDARQGLPAPRLRPPAGDPGPPPTEVERPLAPPSGPLVAAL